MSFVYLWFVEGSKARYVCASDVSETLNPDDDGADLIVLCEADKRV